MSEASSSNPALALRADWVVQRLKRLMETPEVASLPLELEKFLSEIANQTSKISFVRIHVLAHLTEPPQQCHLTDPSSALPKFPLSVLLASSNSPSPGPTTSENMTTSPHRNRLKFLGG